MPNQQTQPNPALLFDTISAYQRSAALKAAVELDLFTAIAEGHPTAEDIARSRQASERGVRILCDFLVISGLLTKEGSAYRLTPDTAAFLDRRSPAYMGSALEFLLSPELTGCFAALTEAVRKGGTASSAEGTVSAENPVWVTFARAMMPMMALPAQGMAALVECPTDRPLKVLDIAAGHGLFGLAFAQRYPNAEIVALDWPAVLQVARENAERAGVANRYQTLPGSAFDVEFGSGYDLVLLTNFLHHFDVPTCESLLRKVHAALAPGGRAVTLEFVPNPDRVSPPPSAAFSLTMLATTPAGDAYTFAELDAMFRAAGFSRSKIHPVPPSMESAIISHR